MTLTETKRDLANFLSEQLTKIVLEDDHELMVAGGFFGQNKSCVSARVVSTNQGNVEYLSSNQEEADTLINNVTYT